MESLLSIWKRHNVGKGTGENWHTYPHWFRAHDSMKAEAESYAASLSELEEGKRAFVVRGHMEGLRGEWARIYAAENDGELPENANELRTNSEKRAPHPDEWATGTGAEYQREHAKGVCSNSRGSCAVALHYFAEYVAEALAAFGVEWEQRSKSEARETKPGGVVLPLELDTEGAREKFAEAIARGWMAERGDGYEWRGVDGKGSIAQFAYFCGRIYGYKWGHESTIYGGNDGEHIPWEALQALFSTKGNLHKSISQVYNAKKPQPWLRIIDSIF